MQSTSNPFSRTWATVANELRRRLVIFGPVKIDPRFPHEREHLVIESKKGMVDSQPLTFETVISEACVPDAFS
jgi:hypothetical protein